MHEMRFIQFLGKRLKNLKLSLRKSRYVFSYQWKSGNAIKQIHISQLTNPTQKTFLGPDYSANVSFLLNSFCQPGRIPRVILTLVMVMMVKIDLIMTMMMRMRVASHN